MAYFDDIYKYDDYIYVAVKAWFRENENRIIHTYEIDELPNEKVLHIFLEWEGIIGYNRHFDMFLEVAKHEQD